MNRLILSSFIVVQLFSTSKVHAQNDYYLDNEDISYGVGAKLNIEFSYKYRPDFKLGITAGVSYNSVINTNYGISPTIHAGLLFFNGRSVPHRAACSFVSFCGVYSQSSPKPL